MHIPTHSHPLCRLACVLLNCGAVSQGARCSCTGAACPASAAALGGGLARIPDWAAELAWELSRKLWDGLRTLSRWMCRDTTLRISPPV